MNELKIMNKKKHLSNLNPIITNLNPLMSQKSNFV